MVPIAPQQSQSPAVNEIEDTLNATAVVATTADAIGIVVLINSPTLPVAALLFVTVPTILVGVIDVATRRHPIPGSVVVPIETPPEF